MITQRPIHIIGIKLQENDLTLSDAQVPAMADSLQGPQMWCLLGMESGRVDPSQQ